VGHTWQECQLAALDSDELKQLPWERAARQQEQQGAPALRGQQQDDQQHNQQQGRGTGGRRGTVPPKLQRQGNRFDLLDE
jgi:hypothetical protein